MPDWRMEAVKFDRSSAIHKKGLASCSHGTCVHVLRAILELANSICCSTMLQACQHLF